MTRTGSRIKVGIVRGPGLSKWEMQIYEPLSMAFELTGIGSTRPVNDISNISFPVKLLDCYSQRIAWLPRMISMMYRFFGDTQWLSGFNKAIQGFDLLHAVELRNGYSLQAVRAKKMGLTRTVTLTVYENIPFVGDQYSRRRAIKEEVILGTDLFFAANKMAREALLLEGAPEGKIVIVPQSVDTDRFTPRQNLKGKSQKLRRKFGIEKDDFVVLSIGRMVWEKGWEDLIACAKSISNDQFSIFKKNRRIRFLFVGEGPELAKYKKMVKRLGLEDTVLFPGGIAYAQMPDLFRIADVFVYASLPTPVWNAQFGGVLIEAMATGLPIVATLSGGTLETIGDKGGIFVQPQHFSHLAEGIWKLYSHPKLRETIGRRNRKVAVTKYDVRVVAQNIEAHWSKLLT